MKTIWKNIALLGILLLGLAGCGDSFRENSTVPVREEKAVVHETTSQTEAFSPQKVSFLAVGDNLIHNVIYQQAAQNASSNSYDFTLPYEMVAPMITKADVAFVNQETPLADTIAPPSNYPLFNTPQDMGRHLVALGFDVVNQATNHILDMGSAGAEATLRFWQQYPEIVVVGLYPDQTHQEMVHMLERNGITMAFVGFTESTNGLSLPKDSPLELVYMSDQSKIEQEIKQAKQVADVVIVSAHWGIEDSHTASPKQRDFAYQMVGWGADVVIGHHPHALQEIEWIEREDGQKALVMYSLGNFISAQKDPQNMVGGMMTWDFVRQEKNGPIQIQQPAFIPTITHYEAGMRQVRIIPLQNYTQELAASHGIHQYGKIFSRTYIEQLFEQTIDPEFYTQEK